MSALEEEDVRAMVRLLGDVCALPGGHAEKKRCLMDGLCRLVDADFWAWVLAAHLRPGDLPVYAGFQHGGFSKSELAKFLAIQAHPQMARYSEPLSAAMHATGGQVTRNVQDIFDYGGFMESDVGKLWAASGVLPRCIAYRPLAGGGVTGIGLYRRSGRALFDERESRIMHILLTEVPWLHELGWPEDRGVKVPELPPRCWLVHEMLLQGMDRTRIAEHLSLSIHTVSGYMKEIYRHFGVNSQAELMGRFFRGDGGDAK